MRRARLVIPGVLHRAPGAIDKADPGSGDAGSRVGVQRGGEPVQPMRGVYIIRVQNRAELRLAQANAAVERGMRALVRLPLETDAPVLLCQLRHHGS